MLSTAGAEAPAVLFLCRQCCGTGHGQRLRGRKFRQQGAERCAADFWTESGTAEFGESENPVPMGAAGGSGVVATGLDTMKHRNGRKVRVADDGSYGEIHGGNGG